MYDRTPFLVLPCLQIYSTLLVVYSTVALDLLYRIQYEEL